MSSQPTGQAVVVGGGIGGLAAGVALGRAGWRVPVLEQRRADELDHRLESTRAELGLRRPFDAPVHTSGGSVAG